MAGSPVPEAQGVTIRLSTGSPTGNFGPFGVALVEVLAAILPDVRLELIDTPGSLQNLEDLQQGTADLGLAQAGVAYMAYNGRLPGLGRPLHDIRGIAVLNSSSVHMLVGPGSPITSIEDLQNRHVGIGPVGSGNAATAELLLDGFESVRNVRRNGAAVAQAMELLLAGGLDAVFITSGIPNAEVGRATQAGARLVDIRGASVDRLRTRYPFLRSDIIPGGVYAGHPERIHTLSVDIVLLARAGLDDALVHRLTAALFQGLPMLSARLYFLRSMDVERAPATPIELHPGAALYYREQELSR